MPSLLRTTTSRNKSHRGTETPITIVRRQVPGALHEPEQPIEARQVRRSDREEPRRVARFPGDRVHEIPQLALESLGIRDVVRVLQHDLDRCVDGGEESLVGVAEEAVVVGDGGPRAIGALGDDVSGGVVEAGLAVSDGDVAAAEGEAVGRGGGLLAAVEGEEREARRSSRLEWKGLSTV